MYQTKAAEPESKHCMVASLTDIHPNQASRCSIPANVDGMTGSDLASSTVVSGNPRKYINDTSSTVE